MAAYFYTFFQNFVGNLERPQVLEVLSDKVPELERRIEKVETDVKRAETRWYEQNESF